MLAFKVYRKGWDDGDHVISREVWSPQADNDIDDIEESERLGESINLPSMLSPPPRYVPSQVCVSVNMNVVHLCEGTVVVVVVVVKMLLASLCSRLNVYGVVRPLQ